MTEEEQQKVLLELAETLEVAKIQKGLR